MENTAWIRVGFAACVIALVGCGANASTARPTTPTSDPSSAAGQSELPAARQNELSGLADSGQPYLRAHADLVRAALRGARGAVADAENPACAADAEAMLDALVGLMEAHAAAAIHGVRALAEVRVRLAACQRNPCELDAQTLDAQSRSALLLDLPDRGAPAGRVHPLVMGAMAVAAQDRNAALEAYERGALAAASCAPIRADFMRLSAGVLDRRSVRRGMLDQALAVLGDERAPRIRGDLLLDRGYTFAGERNYEDALTAYAAAERAYAELGDLGALWVADAQNATAVAFGQLHRTTEAIATNQRVLAVRARVLGEAHPLALVSMSNLAVMAQAAGQTQEALEIHRRMLAVRSSILHPDDPALAVSLDAIGGILTRAGRAEEAVPICRRSVEIRESSNPEARTDRPRSHICLANALGVVGRLQEVLEEVTTAVDEVVEVQGADHPDVANYQLVRAQIAEQAGDQSLAAASRAEAARIRANRATQ